MEIVPAAPWGHDHALALSARHNEPHLASFSRLLPHWALRSWDKSAIDRSCGREFTWWFLDAGSSEDIFWPVP